MTSQARKGFARLVVAVCLIALAAGTISGSSPDWPDPVVYAVCAFVTGAVWCAAAITDARPLQELADAALIALAVIRAAGYVIDLVRTGQESFIAAIAAWCIVAVLATRPLRHDPA